ncbi:phosphate ABC transporter permease PstA [Halopenitus sp. POP-27]|uniref:phosphate ABC transporter permease PstA n=1 Tax=Halopenitus sp. POP-27 TaxID=2994425 RepID=UPI002469B73E|nr:phosphate ABC transporter permease PstA [Halopenitus sp. POP-27]
MSVETTSEAADEGPSADGPDPDAGANPFARSGWGPLYRALRDKAFAIALLLAALSGIAMVFILLAYVALDAFSILDPEYGSWVDWQFLTNLPSRTPSEAGFLAPIVGSLLILVVMVFAVFPIGIGAAVYLEEYAPDNRITQLVQINIANLAGVPSVVYGLLGLAVFVRGIGLESGIVLVGGLTVGLLVLPIVIVSSQEALRAVPDSYRQASRGMGASDWQTLRNVTLPQALPGILTGTILALGRAIGETAPLIMIGAATSVFSVPTTLFDSVSAMPMQIYNWRARPQPEFRYGVVAAGVVVLLAMMILLNATAILLRNRYQRSDT